MTGEQLYTQVQVLFVTQNVFNLIIQLHQTLFKIIMTACKPRVKVKSDEV